MTTYVIKDRKTLDQFLRQEKEQLAQIETIQFNKILGFTSNADLDLSSCTGLKNIIISTGARVKSITINSAPLLKKILLDAAATLDKLVIDSAPELNELDMRKTSEIKNCEIKEAPKLKLLNVDVGPVIGKRFGKCAINKKDCLPKANGPSGIIQL